MKYALLVGLYEKLVSTTKRLEKTAIIADFIKKTADEDLADVINLISGRVFPLWDSRTIGFSSRLLIKAISASTGASSEKIEKEMNRVGDLGDVAASLTKNKTQRTLFSQDLSVKKVVDNLKKLATMEGQGSVDKKIGLVAELLSSASADEAKYIARMVLEVLRVGIADGIIKDAIAKAFDKEIQDIDEAFDLLVDHGEVALLAKSNSLGKISVKPGRPLKLMLAILAKNIEEGFSAVGKPAALEHKYDGFRCITGFTPIYVDGKGLISVKDVCIGDEVLTHRGRFKKVVAVNIRKISKNEKLYKIQTYFGDEFKITEKHPLLITKNGKIVWEVPENLKRTDRLAFPIPKIRKRSILKGILKLSDSSGYKKNVPVNNFFFRFLGYWIGDGFTNEYHNTERVGIIFNNKKDKKLCQFYKDNIIKNFKLTKVSENIHNGAIYLYWRDKPLRQWLTKHFRREWKGKMLPEWFYGITSQQFDEFLRGWIEADGYTDKIGRTSITTKERDLAMFAQLLGLMFNRIIGVKKLRINDKTYYRLTIPKTMKKACIVKNHCFSKIFRLERIRKPDPRTTLYNLQIEGDESYCTTMASLHNCQIHNDGKEIKLFTRNMEDVTKQFPDVVANVKENVKAKNYIIDCEAVGYSPKTRKYLPFQSISQRIRRKYETEEMAKKFPVEVNVFDIIYYNGKRMLQTPFKERRKLIEKIIIPAKKKIKLSDLMITDDAKKVQTFFNASLKEGHEGLIFKALASMYKPGRYVGYMAKLKDVMDALDLVVVKAEWGEGKRASWLTSYTVACRDNGNYLEVGKVSTGLKEKAEEGETASFENITNDLKKLIISEKGKEVTVKPQIIVEVSYEEIQKSPTYTSTYALRFPRILRVRFDKHISEIATIKNVETLYKSQNK